MLLLRDIRHKVLRETVTVTDVTFIFLLELFPKRATRFSTLRPGQATFRAKEEVGNTGQMSGFVVIVISILLGSLFLTTRAMAVEAGGKRSCAVIGVGVLGTRLCELLLAEQSSEVTGVTKTDSRHESIRESVGATGRFHLTTFDEDVETKFEDVVFCAPPSGFEDYPAAVTEAAKKYWAGQDGGGVFVFTSSGAV